MSDNGLDPLIHVPTRLKIVATLAALPDGDGLSFTRLQDMLELTPGNLIIQLRKLEDAGYISTEGRDYAANGRRAAVRSAAESNRSLPSGRLFLSSKSAHWCGGSVNLCPRLLSRGTCGHNSLSRTTIWAAH